jgi:hypothetical protein
LVVYEIILYKLKLYGIKFQKTNNLGAIFILFPLNK